MGDPRCLTIAADARISPIDYCNDQIWELSLGGGEPEALALATSFGLRARAMKVFPKFLHKNTAYQAPESFLKSPRLRIFYPNYLCITFTPFNGIDVTAEYWCPSSRGVAGLLHISNQNVFTETFRLEWVGLLHPLGEGRSMEVVKKENSCYLAGKTSSLEILFALNCLAVPGTGPWPSLAVDVEIIPGKSRKIGWALSGSETVSAAFDQINDALAHNWSAETSRIERTHERDVIEIHTGNPEWDAAMAFSQKAAFNLVMPASRNLPKPSFVLSRQPDRGYSALGDGTDYTQLWSGQTPLDAYFLNSILLPGGAEFAAGVVENFLSVQDENGFIDLRPGLAGQRTRLLAQPLLAALALQAARHGKQPGWLNEVLPGLLRFIDVWFDPEHDRDQDGFPEWTHPTQTGLDEAPIYNPWHDGLNQGVDISILESPSLAAMLYNELECLKKIALLCGADDRLVSLQTRLDRLKSSLDLLWNNSSATYQYRDIEAHKPSGVTSLVNFKGPGSYKTRKVLKLPQRLLVRFTFTQDTATHPVMVAIHGENPKGEVVEKLVSNQFFWSGPRAHTTTRNLFSRIHSIEVAGIGKDVKGVVTTVNYQQDDLSVMLPLWAGVPTPSQASAMIKKTMFGKYLRPYGIPINLESSGVPAVAMHWNHLLGEGLLRYGHQHEAADLVTHLMSAVCRSLKENGEFRDSYNAVDGKGIGDENTLHGLAPTGLFLSALGVQWIGTEVVILRGANPFPWPVTLKYQGKEIVRRAGETILKSSNGRIVSVGGTQPRQVTFS